VYEQDRCLIAALLQDILNEPDEIQSLRGGNAIARRMSVHEIPFSAHVDHAQNSEFIELIKAQHIVRVSPSAFSEDRG